MLDLLTGALLAISNALLIPVILCIFGLLLWTLLLAGGFAREWLERRKLSPLLDRSVTALRQRHSMNEVWRVLEGAVSGLPRRFTEFVGENRDDKSILEQALATLENDVASSLAR